MSKHTPGPWSLHKYQNGYGTPVTSEDGEERWMIWEYSIGAGETLLGHAKASTGEGGYPKPQTREEAEANARLMAAAPELLECVRDFVAIYDNLLGNAAAGKFARLKADRVIAKATGQAE